MSSSTLQRKMEDIKELLEPVLAVVKAKIEANEELIKPRKISFVTQVSVKLSELLRKYRPLDYNSAMMLDVDTIEQHFHAYMELVSWINEYCILPPNKQHFCALLQITNNQYLALLEGRNPEIVSVMEGIEDYFIGETFTASQSGQVKEKATLTRLKAKGQGHSIQENKAIDTVIINNQFDKSPTDMLERLQQIKKLGGK